MEKFLYIMGERYQTIESGICDISSMVRVLRGYTELNSTNSEQIGNIDFMLVKIIDEVDKVLDCF